MNDVDLRLRLRGELMGALTVRGADARHESAVRVGSGVSQTPSLTCCYYTLHSWRGESRT